MTYYYSNDPRIISNGGGLYANIHVDENTTFVTDVETFDTISTEENGRLTYKIVGGRERNQFEIDSKTGVLSFKDAPNFENPTDGNRDGDYNVSVRVIDGAGYTDTQHIRVVVKDVDESPSNSNIPEIISNGGGDSATIHVDENTTFVTDVETFDTISTEENGRLTYKIVGGRERDHFEIDSKTGVLSFKDAPDFENPTDGNLDGDYNVKVKVIDGAGFTDTQSIRVVVKDVNEAPHANNDHVSVDEGQMVTIDVLGNDTDPDGDTLTIDSVGAGPANGTAEIVNGEIKYTPDAGFTGDDTFEYKVSDGNGGTDKATVKVTVNDVNFAPDAVNDHVSVDEGQMVTIDVLGNDTDPDGDALTIESIVGDGPANGTAEIVNGKIKYTPDADFIGEETFEYTVSDGKGGTDTATVKVTVNDVNEAPHANNDHVSVDEGQMVEIDVLGNDTDPDGDALTIESVVDPANGTAEIVNGKIKYTPDADFIGEETFEYTVSDGKGGTDTATVKVTVNDVNEAPHANNDHVSVDEGQMVEIDVLGNDTDPDGDALTIESVVDPANGTAEIVNGKIKYTPDADFIGEETFEYTVSDGKGGTDTATVKVTVNDVNEAPHANNDHVSVDEGQMVEIDVLGNDTDPDGDALTIESVVDPANGTAEIVNGKIKYTPDADFIGEETFEYTVSDGKGGTDTATVKVTVNDVNEAPHANNDHVSVDEGQMVEIDVLGNDTDPDGDALTIESVVDPANGTAEIVNGKIKYTPDADFIGEETFEYTVSDGKGGTDTATVKVTVNGANEVPIAGKDNVIIEEGQTATIDVLANDTDADGDVLSIDSIFGDGPANGTVEIVDDQILYTPNDGFFGTDTFKYLVTDGKGATARGTVNVTIANEVPIAGKDNVIIEEGQTATIDVLANDTDADGDVLSIDSIFGDGPANGTVEIVDDQILYTPNDGFFGTDTFKYLVTDGKGATARGTVNVTIANEVPIAGKDNVIIEEGQTATIDVLANDTDADGDVLSIDSIFGDGPANGTVEIVDDQILYTPNDGFFGTDTFKYLVTDGKGATARGTVNVTIANEVPIAGKDNVIIEEGQTATIDVLANDTDADGDVLSIDSIFGDGPANGTVEIVDDQILYTPNDGFFGTDTFRYLVTDGKGATARGTVNVTIANEVPIAGKDNVIIEEGQTATIDVLANDTDADGDVLSIDSIFGDGPANGTVEIVDDQILYTPNDGFFGTDTFRYLVTDGKGATGRGTVNVTVNEVVQEDPILGDGNYRLGNHPDGNAPGPGYGLRLDGLLTGDANDIFTFDFENSHSNVEMSIAGGGSQVSISGTVFGGLVDPVTGEYVEGQSGSWDVHFTYTNVENLSGDDDLIVDDSLAGTNTGTITPQFGNQEVIALEDFAGQNANTFQLGDLEDDGGFRGFSGVSGWGWLQAGDNRLVDSDWLFTVQEPIVH